MESLLEYDLQSMQEKIVSLGLEKYRAAQVFSALHLGQTFEEITTLNQKTKELLIQNYISQPVSVIKTLVSQDGTQKYLFKLADGNIVEGVLMKYKFGFTLCISTQVGCAMGCKFCASGLNGMVRNLTASEMVGQVVAINKSLGGELGENRKITNIVLMGAGEPLANYKNVTKFIDLVTDKNGLYLSQRNISLSTCGIVPNIYKLADDGYKIMLTISLHAPNDEIRKSIMKIANSYTIKEVLDACKYYSEKTNRRIMFEYILIKGINDSKQNAKQLAELVKGLNAHINLIPLNEVEGIDLKTVERQMSYEFLKLLESYGINATLRRTLGEDIDGACGQLRAKFVKQTNSNENI